MVSVGILLFERSEKESSCLNLFLVGEFFWLVFPSESVSDKRTILLLRDEGRESC